MKSGGIIRVEVQDFVTYSYTQFFPSENLNVIVGPNGSGKSTIIAAIILGLAGTPKTIGRGTKISEYIKFNCKEAKIILELQGTEPDTIHIIKRIMRPDNQSKWYLNDKHVGENVIKHLIKSLNIQVDNLCQFLPQDRVQDFARMNKKELLSNTQRAIGREDLIDKQTTLINMKDEQHNFSKDLEKLKKKLEKNRAEVSRLESKVKNLNEKKLLLNEVTGIKRKLAWLMYDRCVTSQKDIEKDKKKQAAVIEKYEKKINPTKIKVKSLRNHISSLEKIIVEKRELVSKYEREIKKLLDQDETLNNEQKEVAIDLDAQLNALDEYQNEIDVITAKIDKLVNDENSMIQQYGTVQKMEQDIVQLNEESRKYDKDLDRTNVTLSSAQNVFRRSQEYQRQLEDSLQEMQNLKEKRLNELQRRDRDAYTAVLWLRQNRHMFRGEIYEPIMIELNVLNPAHCKYIENIVSHRDRVAFTCEHRDDMNLFMKLVRDGQKLKVNVVHSGQDHPSLASYQPKIPIEQLRGYGFFAYVKSLVDGPEAILKYLCRMYSIENIPIGDATTYERAEQVPPQIRLFFSDTHRFAVSVSRYTNAKSTRISSVESDGSFSVCVDLNRMNELRCELENLSLKHDTMKQKIQEMRNKIQMFENHRIDSVRKRQAVVQKKELLLGVRDRLVNAKHTLNSYKAKMKSEEEYRLQAQRKYKNICLKYKNLYQIIIETFESYDEAIKQTMLKNVERNVTEDEIINLENDISELMENYVNAKEMYTQIEATYREAEWTMNDSLQNAKKLSGGFDRGDREFKQYRQEYNSLPANEHELETHMEHIRTRIDCILAANDGELELYEVAQRTIVECEEQIKSKERNEAEYGNQISTLYNEWIQPLREYIDKINGNFSHYFNAMGCAGAVELCHGTDPTNYSEYWLAIKVTYRDNEAMQELDSYRQSGGERTVATAIFLIALQNMTAAPFRCVDEINQGMDPVNERRFFSLLVKATATKESSQYFIVTPKLVRDLKFGPYVCIHFVFNDPVRSLQVETEKLDYFLCDSDNDDCDDYEVEDSEMEDA